MPHNFHEMNDRIHTVERAIIDAENDAEFQRDADIARELARIEARRDRSIALHEFILDRRTCPPKGYRI